MATVVSTVMKIFPMAMNIAPRLPAMANKNVFLRIRKNASLQDVQKLCEVIAH